MDKIEDLINHLAWCAGRWEELGSPNPQEYRWSGQGNPTPEYQAIEGLLYTWEEWCLALYGPGTTDETKVEISDDDIPF